VPCGVVISFYFAVGAPILDSAQLRPVLPRDRWRAEPFLARHALSAPGTAAASAERDRPSRRRPNFRPAWWL